MQEEIITSVLGDLPERARIRSAAGFDTVVDLRELTPALDGAGNWYLAAQGGLAAAALEYNPPVRLAKTAQRQLCTLIGAPREYLIGRKGAPGLPPELVQQCLNAGLLSSGADMLLRCSKLSEDGQNEDWRLRSLLPPNKRPIDDADVLAALESVLPEFPDAARYRQEWNESHTRLDMTLEGADLEDSDGDIGFTLSNSEVGLAPLKITGFIARSICSNGLIVGTPLSALKFAGGLGDWQAEIRAAIFAGVEEARRTVSLYQRAVHTAVADPRGALLLLSRQAQIGVEPLLAAFEHEPQSTVAGVLNAITRAAQDLSGPSRMRAELAASDWLNAQSAGETE